MGGQRGAESRARQHGRVDPARQLAQRVQRLRHPVDPATDPFGLGGAGRRITDLLPEAPMVGRTLRPISASSRRLSVSAAPMMRLREAASCRVRSIQLPDPGRELDLQPDVAEGQRGLLGDVGQQPLLDGTYVASRRQRQADRPEDAGPVLDRHHDVAVARVARSLGPRTARTPPARVASSPSRRTTARSACTASPAAAAIVGSSWPGTGLRPIRRLNSASASYGSGPIARTRADPRSGRRSAGRAGTPAPRPPWPAATPRNRRRPGSPTSGRAPPRGRCIRSRRAPWRSRARALG